MEIEAMGGGRETRVKKREETEQIVDNQILITNSKGRLLVKDGECPLLLSHKLKKTKFKMVFYL